jgi:hypothetical protein
MFFRNLLCTFTLATLASAAVAKQIPNSYNSGESESTTDEIFEREAEPEPARTAVWEQAHGGPAPSYKYGEEHDSSAWHIARDATPMAEAESGWANVGGHRQKKSGNHFAREAEPEAEPGWANVGASRQKRPGNWASSLSAAVKNAISTDRPFIKGGPSKFADKLNQAREADGPDSDDADDEDADDEESEESPFARNADPNNLEIPDFGDQVVDTSLEGLLVRRNAEGDDDEDDEDDSDEPYDASKIDLSGYDAGILQSRSDGTADEIDYSLEGMVPEKFKDEEEEEEIKLIQARDLAGDQVAQDDEYLNSDEHRKFLASYGVTERSFEDDMQDAEHDRIDARDVKEEKSDDDDETGSEYYDPDAAYANAEVVEELTAPEPELE